MVNILAGPSSRAQSSRQKLGGSRETRGTVVPPNPGGGVVCTREAQISSAADTCMFWTTVSIGGLLRGMPASSVRRYIDLLSTCRRSDYIYPIVIFLAAIRMYVTHLEPSSWFYEPSFCTLKKASLAQNRK